MQDKRLLKRAAENRRVLTPFEARLWSRLNRSQLGGYKFRRQHVIDGCIVDFFCPGKGLIIEVDGDTHDPVRDARRDRRHANLGFRTLRFSNRDVAQQLDSVLSDILAEVETLPDRWPGAHPHPSIPSPEGEGKT